MWEISLIVKKTPVSALKAMNLLPRSCHLVLSKSKKRVGNPLLSLVKLEERENRIKRRKETGNMRGWVRWSNRWMKEGKEGVSSPANRINTVKENRKMSITTNLQSTPRKELFRLPDKFSPVISTDDKSSKWTDYSIFTDRQEPPIKVYSKSSSSSET